MKSIFFSIILFLINSVHAQADESRNFAILINDSIVYGENVKFLFKPKEINYVQVDSVKYNYASVKFFKNETGYFACLSSLASDFYVLGERENKGKLNLYDATTPKTSFLTDVVGNPLKESNSKIAQKVISYSADKYYNKGYEELKTCDFDNLKVDLADSPESMKHLQLFKNERNMSYIKSTIGTIFLGTGMMMLMTNNFGQVETTKSKRISNNIVGIGFFSFGIAFDIAGFKTYRKAKTHVNDAIEIYNK